MSRSLYVASLEPDSGKSLVVLGLAELLASRVKCPGIFRPVIHHAEPPDNDMQLIHSRYCPSQSLTASYGATLQEARDLFGQDRDEELLKRTLSKYKQLEEDCDFVLCEGTDGTDGSFFSIDFNARLANHLGSPVVAVVSGQDKTRETILDAVRSGQERFQAAGCTLAAIMLNRVPSGLVEQLRAHFVRHGKDSVPVFVLPEHPSLACPTVAEIQTALGADLLLGSEESLRREALDLKVAAMYPSNFLTHLEEGSLVITPGDRVDVLLASLATVSSDTYPPIAGILLTGGIPLADSVLRLLKGMRIDLPVLSIPDDTLAATEKVTSIRAAITPENDRKIAAALGVFESAVDRELLATRIEVARPSVVTPLMFEHQLVERAKADRKHIVLPEGTDERILRATEILLRRQVAKITLLGPRNTIEDIASSAGIDIAEAAIIDPAESAYREDFGREYYELRKHKDATPETAYEQMLDVSYFGTMMVYRGLADAMVSGAAHTTGHTIRPALEFIRVRPGGSIVSSVFFMCLPTRVLVYGDCAIVPNPTAPQLADIAISSANTAALLGVEPRVALLSYSTGKSGAGDDVDLVREATRLAQEHCPDLPLDGPLQYDAAIDPDVGRRKRPDSPVAGQANVFIFPDLNTGNNTYKAVQRSSGAVAIGPVLQGLNKPVNDLSRGCTVADIVNTVAITAIQAQEDASRS